MLLLADVDGTLVTQDKVLTEQAMAAAQELRKAGITLALTSGRPPRGMSMLIEPLKLEGAIAGFNGGVFVNPDLSVIDSHILDFAAAQETLQLILDAGLDAWVYTEKGLADPRSQSAACRARDLDGEVRRQGRQARSPTQHLAKTPSRSSASPTISKKSRPARSWRNRSSATSASAARSQPYYLDVTHPQANKGAVVLTLAKLQNICAGSRSRPSATCRTTS